MNEIIILVVAVFLMSPGLLMPLMPMLPALPYMFVVAFLFAWYGKFSALSSHELFALVGIVVLSIVVDQLAGVIGAKWSGAHMKSLLWGIGGAMLGALLVPPFGAFPGLFISVFVAETYYRKTNKQALKSAAGAMLGAATGVVINMVIALTFLISFLFFVLR